MKKASLKLFRKFKKLDLFSWIMYIVVVAWVFSLICVLGICVLNSFKGDWDIIKYSFFEFSNLFSDDPRLGFHIENYVNIFRPVIKGVTDIETSKYYNYLNVIVGEASNKVYIYELLWNSVFYSTMMTLFLIATQVMVAYAVAKYNFKILNWYYRVAVIVMLIPIVGSLASELRFLKFFSFENNVLGVSIMRCKYPGIYFLVFYAMFKGLSSTYMEAAQLDGAGHLQIFLQIMLPLVKSTIFAVFILLFIQNWNDYYTPMLFLREKPVLTYALYQLQMKTTGLEFNKKYAACVSSAVPIVLLFIIFRNKIMGNVTMGGIKG